ncbi:type III-A CRISPR-associated protein Cas10/Csm1 [Pasteurella sp. PK-2025]|uniref:type III-A CRISPR-associated protein Cas10/Csm1 n=1 Tax=Pasteurella sp. PK-2025 TaxID=3413133 RepID=UPI003C778CCE
MTNLLFPSCRVAFAALIHDLGKFTQRAKLPISQDQLNSHKQLYSPFNQEKGLHSHIHAAYTAFSIDQLEKFLPDLIQHDLYPFSSRQQCSPQEMTDSLINAAAAHHKPDTFLQWVIATADRVASGFERDEFDKYNASEESECEKTKNPNHYQARLLSLFEQINQSNKNTHEAFKYCYPLTPLSPQSIFPNLRQADEPTENNKAQQQYAELWQAFLNGLEKIPTSHRQTWDLWLDHFDTAYQCFTSSIPSATAFGVKPEVSLYDHSKTTAALATALWRWHEENGLTDNAQVSQLQKREESWNENKFLLIQGDFFGIQDFIFSGGSDTNKEAAKLLRGRSFQVSLFTELAALKILHACQLPSTSQILNAAGKFLIVAPNTESVKQALIQVQQEFNQWFIEQTYGLIGLGIASLPASCNDFISDHFSTLQQRLFQQLEKIKLQRLDLTENTNSVQEIQYPYGVCKLNSAFPAYSEEKYSLLSLDQIEIGKQLTKKQRIIICDQSTDLSETGNTKALKQPIFGYNVIFTNSEDQTGKFGNLAKANKIYRFWDFSLPKNLTDAIWNGYARRYINAYIPLFNELDCYESGKYKNTEETAKVGDVKTFDFIACEDRQPLCRDGKVIEGQYEGQVALMTLKGDVDNLGLIFQQGLKKSSFAKMASLSRQVNQFFSLWLPAYCASENANMYTVFAGGDDFFLIGPWYSTQKLAKKMQAEFARYVTGNPTIHFSAGMVMSKLGMPVPYLGNIAEEALEKAKQIEGKNAATLYQRSLPWHELMSLNALEEEIIRLAEAYQISTSYLYSLIHLSDLAADQHNIEATMWRSHFYYRTARYVLDKLKKENKNKALKEMSASLGEQGIAKFKRHFAIPLFNYFYQKR